jgi:hypothetical protein
MPLYFYKHDRAKEVRQLSLLWLFAPQLALARWVKSSWETRAYVAGLWHYVRNQQFARTHSINTNNNNNNISINYNG